MDALAGYIATPVTARRGLLARLHYLTRTPHARAAARAAGLTVTDRTLRAWAAGTRSPSRKNLEAIERAYRTVRRENVARYLLCGVGCSRLLSVSPESRIVSSAHGWRAT